MKSSSSRRPCCTAGARHGSSRAPELWAGQAWPHTQQQGHLRQPVADGSGREGARWRGHGQGVPSWSACAVLLPCSLLARCAARAMLLPAAHCRRFLGKWGEPAAWLNARLAYTRTAGARGERVQGEGWRQWVHCSPTAGPWAGPSLHGVC